MSLASKRRPELASLQDAQVLERFRAAQADRRQLYARDASDEDLDANDSVLFMLEDELCAREIDY